MDVHKQFNSGRGLLLTVIALSVISFSGCLNPNYAYLTPPGFSSTAHRVKMQQAQQNLLASHEKSHPHQKQPAVASSEAASTAPATAEKGHWWDHWPKGPISIGPAISTKPDGASSSEKSKVAAEPQPPTT